MFDQRLFENGRCRISDSHSINRVKRAMEAATRPHFNKQRAAALYIKCRKWLGTWGPSI